MSFVIQADHKHAYKFHVLFICQQLWGRKQHKTSKTWTSRTHIFWDATLSVNGWVVGNVSKDYHALKMLCLTLDGEGTTILWNVKHNSPNVTMSHASGAENLAQNMHFSISSFATKSNYYSLPNMLTITIIYDESKICSHNHLLTSGHSHMSILTFEL
jgi:uncharacterized phage-like protein YoqJ